MVKRKRGKAEKAKRQERQERQAGEIIPPAPPWFCRRLRHSAGRECAGKARCRRWRRLERRGLRMPGCLAGAVRAADSVQVCPFGPTCGGRLLSGLRRTVVSKEGFPDFGEGTPRTKPQMGLKCRPENLLSTLWGPGRRQEPGRRQASSRNSFPALNAAAVVQVPQDVRRVLGRRDVVESGRGESGR